MKSKYRKLEALYSKIPNIKCKGLCHPSCTIVPAAKIEMKRARERMGKNPFNPIVASRKLQSLTDTTKIPTCQALSEGRCSIYTIRPAICRIYGVAQGLDCHFGCKADKTMTKDEAYALIREIEAL